MSVENTSVVDFVSLDTEGNVLLTISDHLDWINEREHLLLLEEKINTYCIFVETGQIYDKYPEARDCRPLVSVVLFHEPTTDAEAFFAKVKRVLDAEGFGFDWKAYHSQS